MHPEKESALKKENDLLHECPFFAAIRPRNAFFSHVYCEVIANIGKNWHSFKEKVKKLGKYANLYIKLFN
jgi:hypothetical protein